MTAETVTNVIAGITLVIFWTATVLGGAAWISKALKTMRDEIIADFNAKHDANNRRYETLHTLVIRHDTWLNPDYSRAAGNTSRDRHG